MRLLIDTEKKTIEVHSEVDFLVLTEYLKRIGALSYRVVCGENNMPQMISLIPPQEFNQ